MSVGICSFYIIKPFQTQVYYVSCTSFFGLKPCLYFIGLCSSCLDKMFVFVFRISVFYYVFGLSKRSSLTAFQQWNTTALCSPGDGGIPLSIPSQANLASSSSLDLFDPLPTTLSTSINPTRKTPESFLGPNAALVNLDSLVTKPAQPASAVNPFLASTGGEMEKNMWNVLTLFNTYYRLCLVIF